MSTNFPYYIYYKDYLFLGVFMDNSNNIDSGFLKIKAINAIDNTPVENARLQISYEGAPGSVIEELITNSSGETDIITLPAPPLEYSLTPSINQPYAQYTISINSSDFQPLVITGSSIMSREISIQPINLNPIGPSTEPGSIVIPANTLFGDFPPKIAEEEIKPMNESGEIVLSKVVVPEYIIVHDGPPSDSAAKNYYIRYRDYIKNVASSEIYPTWPDATLRANILAIMSFTLNRVYTEWYRGRGYDFTITSSTAFDHKWTQGRNVFENISQIVDEIFNCYLSRPNVKQPILTQYCDGKRTTCPNWMSQWGSKYLGDQNYTDIGILQYYYGSNMYINTAEEISGIPASYPGYNLTIGSSGENVRIIQEQLNRISDTYSAIPQINVDGIFGENTRNAVIEFQRIFNLTPDGIIGFATWYRISDMYVRLTRIAELNG